MTDRFVIRPDREGHSIIDMWTGEAVVIAMTPQTGMSRNDAEHTAGLLNTMSVDDDPSVRV